MAAPLPFNEFVAALQSLSRPVREDAVMQQQITELVERLREIGPLTRESLGAFVQTYPDSVPILATCVGLTQEQFKNQLSHRLDTSGWVTLARTRPAELIAFLDGEFGLVTQLQAQLSRPWTFADVLVERFLWSRRTATSAVGRGRGVEDEVEAVIKRIGVPYAVRTRFVGRSGEDAPCDLAIPHGGAGAQIVVAMKGFNSTGSKLTDAVTEIARMAAVRAPRQYVFAVVDGIGWRNRKADLRRIHALWDSEDIDGLYTLSHLGSFEVALRNALQRLNIVADA
ncbi:hypothetical protein [Longimicrobium terrae]|uniref:Restriction endonuclease type II DpnII-like domain-containing protein n=1 Tax=Longimicrobium terrae TaxID=1639882 RepID=A0A841GVI3_9BACT|nr:hypothetical protein [Longimicrobium terrae]MBB4634959.1 hypothetical protein [Longimicrobium terrae]MBB6069353.1 hypothetical protein [Longimicrobium terrae]